MENIPEEESIEEKGYKHLRESYDSYIDENCKSLKIEAEKLELYKVELYKTLDDLDEQLKHTNGIFTSLKLYWSRGRIMSKIESTKESLYFLHVQIHRYYTTVCNSLINI